MVGPTQTGPDKNLTCGRHGVRPVSLAGGSEIHAITGHGSGSGTRGSTGLGHHYRNQRYRPNLPIINDK